MRKIYTSMVLTAFVLSISMTGTIAYAKNDKHDDYYSFPGNSAFGRSHNPHFREKFMLDEGMYEKLEALIARLTARLNELNGRQGGGKSAIVSVTTEDADVLNDDSAALNGSVELDDSERARVWFQFGTRTNALYRTTKTQTLRDDGSFSVMIRNLDEDTTYYYRAVAQDVYGRRDFGDIESFTAGEEDDDSDSDKEEPTVATGQVSEVAERTAELTGTVDMEDFDSGRVFFIFGEDEDMVADARNEDSLDDIDEDGDDLRTEVADSNFDGSDTISLEVDELDPDTTYFYAIAVEYENDDVETLVVGKVRSFTTED
jgi:hypothetical protein